MESTLWILGVMITTFSGVVAFMFKRISNNEKRIQEYAILFAEIKNVPYVLEKHEQKEEQIFKELHDSLNDIGLQLHNLDKEVALVKRSINGIK